MNDAGWQVGDLALCLDDNWAFKHADNPQLNEILTVQSVVVGINATKPIEGLTFLERSLPADKLGWSAARFRKIRPHEQAATQAAAANLFSKLSLERQQACLRELKGKSA